MSGGEVTFVVLVYNNEQYIERLLQSLIESTVQDLRVIINDDCSQDRSAEKISRFMADNKEKVRNWRAIYSEKNVGINASLLRIARSVKTDWIKYIAGDDEFRGGSVERYIELARLYNPNKTIVQTNMTMVDASSQFIREKRAVRSWIYQSAFIRNVNLYVNSINAPTVMIGSSVLIKALESTKVKNAEDWPVLKTAIVENICIRSVAESLINYRIHGESLSHHYHSGRRRDNKVRNTVNALLQENMFFAKGFFTKLGIQLQIESNRAETPMRKIAIRAVKLLNVQYFVYRVCTVL